MDHPEPLLRSKPCPPKLLPTSAARLVRKAEAAGLKSDTRIAIGWALPREGRPLGDVVRSIVVKVQKADVLLVGNWENGKFRRGYRVPGKLGFPDRLSAAELSKEVS